MSREPDLLAIRRGVDRMGRLSDNIVRLGPFSLGLDGVLSWIPGIGEIYSGAAAAYLLTQGVRARVPVSTLLLAAALMGGRTLITAIPLAGPAASDLLTMHKWSAKLIVAAIDRRLGAQAPGSSAKPGAGRPLWRSRAHDTASA
jgi:hypothetical protein